MPSAPHSAVLPFTGQAAGAQTPAPPGERLDLPLRNGYSRSEEPGVKPHSKQEKSRQCSWGARCFPLWVTGLLPLAPEGLLRTLSVRVIIGLLQSPLKSGEVFPRISVSRVLYWVGHQAAELSQGKLPERRRGGVVRRLFGGTGACMKIRVVTAYRRQSFKEKMRKDVLAGCAECVS